MYEYLIAITTPTGVMRTFLTRTAPLNSEAEVVGAERFIAEQHSLPSVGIFSFTLLSGPTERTEG